MQLSDNALFFLKNFSTINPSLVFREGNVIRTMSNGKTIVAKVELPDTFEKDFGIYDLSRFLSVLSLFDKPDIQLEDKWLTISSGKQKLTYVYADPLAITTPPEKDLEMKSVVANFKIPADALQKALKASAVLQLPEIAIVGSGSGVSITTADNSKDSTDNFSIELPDTESVDAVFRASFKKENLLVVPRDYDVTIDSRGIVKFVNEGVTYWVVAEAKTSRFS